MSTYTSVLHTKENLKFFLMHQTQTRLKVDANPSEEGKEPTFRVTVQGKQGFLIPLAVQSWDNERVEHASATQAQMETLVKEFEARVAEEAVKRPHVLKAVYSLTSNEGRLKLEEKRNGYCVITFEKKSGDHVISFSKASTAIYGSRWEADAALKAFNGEVKKDQPVFGKELSLKAKGSRTSPLAAQ